MKNTIKTFSLSAAALMTLMVGVGNVQAATTNLKTGDVVGDGRVATGDTETTTGKANSTAEFEVTPGDLTLDAVPDMNFGTASVKDIATNGITLTYASGDLTGEASNDGNNKGIIRVSDFRGSGTGWKLSVGLGNFTSGSTNILSGVTLTVNAPKAEGVTTDAASTTVTPENASSVVTAEASEGMGENTYTISSDTKDTTLTIDKNPTIKAGTYQADLTWTLANTPSTTAAK
ncbi:WxL domain-containing protein [Enterococcus diestrammenae]|uniref:WxL domain-containing protein n=1 Tax=Enterococcus diestrammenae TaxID=1155073 RepID=UPI00195DC08F